MEITNDMDYISSQDILERIEELEDFLEETWYDGEQVNTLDDWELHELLCLKSIVEEWGDPGSLRDGVTFINEGYWLEYVQEFVTEIGDISSDDIDRWPFSHINWDEAAEELLIDYQEVDFDGVTY